MALPLTDALLGCLPVVPSGCRGAVISCIERGTRRDDDLANAYREWLTAA
ncbi:hypothetical protein K7B06_09270 [Streptomyces erythrochromogenes]|nr:hypothetical protein [Streptomyces erythrochromogenes]